MNQLLKVGQKVQTQVCCCQVEQSLGSGGQGEVYRANLNNHAVALKWYFPHYIQQDTHLRERLERAVESGPPNNRFLWPIDLASASGIDGFGYIMPLREPRYKSIIDLMIRRIEPSFRALTTAGLELSDSFLQLHAKGLCYRDISFGNVFLEPDTGNILICDNDNVAVNGETDIGILGTPRFMAPEIVGTEGLPNTQTDLFSLAVLLFYLLMIHHPLEGRRESQIKCLDLPAMRKIYGLEPVFIFDPNNDSNRPVPGDHDNAIAFWNLYPQFLRDLFIKAFTEGIKDPKNGRVAEGIWRVAMVRLRDSIIYCPHCGAENFYDTNVLQISAGKSINCWSCQKVTPIPPQIRIGKNLVMLNHDTKLFPHHIDDQKLYDFSQPVAEVTQHPKITNIWGIKNLTDSQWSSTAYNGTFKEIPPGHSVTLTVGTKINFGNTEGEIMQ